jgi:hypothetical protein
MNWTLIAGLTFAIAVDAAVLVTGNINFLEQRAGRAEFADFRLKLDDLNRRACNIYIERVKAGTMPAGDPDFADCKGQ